MKESTVQFRRRVYEEVCLVVFKEADYLVWTTLYKYSVGATFLSRICELVRSIGSVHWSREDFFRVSGPAMNFFKVPCHKWPERRIRHVGYN